MKYNLDPLSAPPTAAEHVGESLTWMSETLDALTDRLEQHIAADPSILTGYAALAQTHAILATAAHLGRIADWLEGIELVDPSADAEQEPEPVSDGDYHALCASCGHPITRRGNAFWAHDDPRRNKSLGGGHAATPIPESIE